MAISGFKILNPAEDFGKAHWELLLYVDYRCVNHNGQLEKEKATQDELDDLIAAGYCQNIGNYLVPTMVMTDLGYQVVVRLTEFKMKEGSLRNFKL